MILLTHPHDIVIVTPPKTASDTLHRVFCGPPWNGLLVVGPHHGTVDKHYPIVPNEGVPCKKLLCVRHPLDRLVSLWCHKHRADAYYGFGTVNFEEFCSNVANGTAKGWMWSLTISDLIDSFQPDGLIRCESLVNDLQSHGLQVNGIPKTNSSLRRPWKDYYTAEMIEVITPWAMRDCKRFNYTLRGE